MKFTLSLKWVAVITAAVFAIIMLSLINPFSTNESGYRQHVRTWSGTESFRFEPGFYYAGFLSKVTTYPDVVTIQFERTENRKNDISFFSTPTVCQFSDGTYAEEVGFTVKWKLPIEETEMLSIHKDYRSYKRLAESLADYSKECAQYSFQMMDSERHYSGGKSELRDHFQYQLRNGQYIMDSQEVVMIDSLTNKTKRDYINKIRKDENDIPILSLSDIQIYKITPNFVAITLVDYEPKVDEKLKAKVDQSTKEAISKQTLVTAQQEALTAEAQGKRLLEETKATEQSEKIKAVIQAEKETAVAAEEAKKAVHVAAKIKAEQEAKATANRLLVSAGLTPEQKMKRDIEIADKVSKNLAGIKFPSMMIIGGNTNGGKTLDPFQAVGLESFLKIQERFTPKD